jgi:hypothetical protein
MFRTWIWDGKQNGNHSELSEMLNDEWVVVESYSGEGDTWMYILHKCDEDCKHNRDNDD